MNDTLPNSETLEHLGMVAAMYEELGIGELIDELIVQDNKQRKLSLGTLVKSMVINGLGFTQRRLYLSPQFFKNKPTELLLGEGVTSDMLNDDALGRTLDKLYDYGVNELFAFIAEKAVNRLGLTPTAAHNDTTSFHVDGKYPQAVAENPNEAEETLIHITRGYSRDHRPDLKQIALEMIVENEASLPIAMSVASGNSNDKELLIKSVKKHISQLQNLDIPVCVKDSAGYSQAALKEHQETALHWVMRVPETLSAAKKLKEQADVKHFMPLMQGYSYMSLGNSYAGVKQRWLLIHSEAAEARVRHTMRGKLLRQANKDLAAIKKLSKRFFSCPDDAQAALVALEKKLDVVTIASYKLNSKQYFKKPGRPKKNAVPNYKYQLEIHPTMPSNAFEKAVNKASSFIIATDILDDNELSDADVLNTYKNNSKVETGFRFLKAPTFAANTLFLKSPKRIIALLMIMTLCLLVYAALQHRIRTTLVEEDLYVPNQKGKPTQKPTAQWVFELFQDVHLLTLQEKCFASNVIPELYDLLDALGARYLLKYPKLLEGGAE